MRLTHPKIEYIVSVSSIDISSHYKDVFVSVKWEDI